MDVITFGDDLNSIPKIAPELIRGSADIICRISGKMQTIRLSTDIGVAGRRASTAGDGAWRAHGISERDAGL